MFTHIDDVIINEKYISYAYVFKRENGKIDNWVLCIKFVNGSHYGDSIELNYKTKQEADEKLKELGENLFGRW